MNEVGTVNSQLIDQVASTVTLLTGQAPSQAFGLLDAVMVETLGMAMHNAVSRQQNSGMVSSAAVTAACAKMLAVPFPLPPAPKPDPTPAPTVAPLPSLPPDLTPGAMVAAAFAQAEQAIDTLKSQGDGSGKVAHAAMDDLSKLIVGAGGVPPTNTITDDITPDDDKGGAGGGK